MIGESFLASYLFFPDQCIRYCQVIGWKMKFEKSLLDSTIKSTTNDCPICASFEEEEGRNVRKSGEKPVLRKSEMQRENVLLLQVFNLRQVNHVSIHV